MKLVCLGDNCIDFYDADGKGYPGGNPVNVGVYTCRLGGEAAYIGAVGTDPNGKLLLEALAAKGVDVSRVQVCPGTTAVTHVSMVEGDRVFGDYDEGVMADFRLREEDFSFIREHDMAVCALWGHVEHHLARIRAMGVPVAFDCSDRPDGPEASVAIPSSNIVFFSDDSSEDEALQSKLRDVFAKGPELVVATRGSRGSLAFDGTDFYAHGIVNCPVVDTMGAGDSFIAGFLYAHMRGASVPACMESGANCSAVTIGYFGAW